MQAVQPAQPARPDPAVVATPSKSADLHVVFRRLPPCLRKDHKTRLLFQKLGKSLDQKNSTLATQGAHLQALQTYAAEAKEG